MLKRSLQVNSVVRLFLALWLAITPTFVWACSMPLCGAGGPAASGAFVGPGDVVATASEWWGLRAYSLATAGTKSANICNSGDANCADVNTLANGNFDVATATGAPLNCGGAGGTCTVKTLYSKAGTTNCSAGALACDLTNATAATRPTLVLNCNGTKPCMNFSGTQFLQAVGTNALISQAFTVSYVSERTGAFTTQAAAYGNDNGSPIEVAYSTSTSTAFIYANSVLNGTASDSAFHAFQGVFNNASSDIYIDGSSNAGTAGAATIPSGGTHFMGECGSTCGNQFLTGRIEELGIWPIGFSSGQKSSMNSNQHTYWGF